MCQLFCCLERLLIIDGDDLIIDLLIKYGRNKSGTDTLNLVRSAMSCGKNR